MSTPTTYDLLVIGSGQGGGPLAGAASSQGWNTALIERKHIGGSCVNEGCTPTKTMVASARIAHLARRAEDYGVQTGDVHVNLAQVRQRKRDIVKMFREGSRSGLESKGVKIYEGEASFVDSRTVEITYPDGSTERVRGERIVINTGTRPNIPPIDGIDTVEYLTSTTIMELDTVPERLLVLGGGYIGLEFGQMFSRFGSEVTVLQRGNQLLDREDSDVADAVLDILRDEGLEIHLNAEANAMRTTPEGEVSVTATLNGTTRTFSGSEVLMATGRRPNSQALNPAAAGIAVNDRGFIPVNEEFQTATDQIYAIGDITGCPAFTHVAYDDYRILKDNLLNGASRTVDNRLIPYTVFIDPQLGRVGLSEDQAREGGHDIRVAQIPMARVARALETDETRGFMKAIVDAETDQILGATILGVEGGEIMSVLQMAMMGNVPYTAIRDGIFAHPTYAESLNNLFTAME